jgi:hypothetical protein
MEARPSGDLLPAHITVNNCVNSQRLESMLVRRKLARHYMKLESLRIFARDLALA